MCIEIISNGNKDSEQTNQIYSMTLMSLVIHAAVLLAQSGH